MPDPTPRRANLLDAMLLVAGSAVAMLSTRAYLAATAGAQPDDPLPDRLRDALGSASEGANLAMLWLAVLSPVALAIRLRPPRPGGVVFSGQPGAVAALVGTLGATLALLSCLAVMPLEAGAWSLSSRLVVGRLAYVGPAVLGAWMGLALARRWDAEPGAIDRGGRLLGLGWIVAGVVAAGTNVAAVLVITQQGIGVINKAMAEAEVEQAKAFGEIMKQAEAAEIANATALDEAEATFRQSELAMRRAHRDALARVRQLLLADDPAEARAELDDQIRAAEAALGATPAPAPAPPNPGPPGEPGPGPNPPR